MSNRTTRVAQVLIEIEAIGFSPDAPVTFKSGIVSPVYVDNRTLPYWPEQWHTVLAAFQQLIREDNIQSEVIAGMAAAGIPHSAVLGYILRKPSVFVRKEVKEHGTGRLVEGGDVQGKRVALVEDLVTTGSSSLAGVRALREAGAVVSDCLAIISYGFDEARAAFDEADVRLHTLTSFNVVVAEALKIGLFGAEEKSVIEDWFHDPHGWAARQGVE
jgi:orotate phosphoribosyltransferase